MSGFDFVLGGRYRLLAPLGAGGMASVYVAQDERLGRRVAIKILADSLMEDAEFVARFQHEAECAAKLSHPNLVSVHDVGEDGGKRYIVMELVVGRNLKEIIEERGPLATNQIVGIASQVLEGLAYAHSNGLIHRDIKPHNILVARDGTAKLADFGIARAVETSSVTQTAVILGSAHYLSPEQASGTAATAQSDIYSLGVVLYEMATGRPPFDGTNMLAIAAHHIHDLPPSPASVNDEVPRVLDQSIMRALAKDPAERYQTAEEFEQRLGQLSPAEEPSSSDTIRVPATRQDADRLLQQSERETFRPTLLHWIFWAICVSLAAPVVSLVFALWPGLTQPDWLISLQTPAYAVGGGLALLLIGAGIVERMSNRYFVSPHAVGVQTGLLSRHVESMPLGAVAHVRLHQSPIARLLGIGTVELLSVEGPGGRAVLRLRSVPRALPTYEQIVRRISSAPTYRNPTWADEAFQPEL